MAKKCFKCSKIKPLSEFYKHPAMADGRLGKCIECAKLDVANRAAIKALDPDWAAAEAERHRKKQARYRKLGLAAPTTKEARKRWEANNPHKRIANSRANDAVRSGKIKIKTECEHSGTSGVPLEKHHEDYSKPLEVIFLCVPCHGKTRRIK